jgi:transposase
MKAYSQDLRERVLADYDARLGTWTIALKYNVSPSWIRRLVQRRRESGEVTPRSSRNKRVPQWLDMQESIKKLIQEKPDLTLKELQQRLGTSMSIQTLSRALHAMKLTFKKKSSRRRSRIDRT